MNPKNDLKPVGMQKTYILIGAGVVLLLAGLFAWWLLRSDTTQPQNTVDSTASSNTSGPDVKSLASYTLPDGWKESSCPSAAGSVFVVPSGAGNVDCNANPSSPVKISVDPANNKDCNDLQNVQNVSKHICISEYINGRKSLKAETKYNQESSYKKDTTIHAYYIDTGKGVVKVEYIYDADNEFQADFDNLAKSVQVKN